jgi:hypothetical protein
MWSYIPPDAIASSEVVTILLAASEPDAMNARSTSSMCIVDGNLGASPNPPHSSSNEPAIRLSAPFTASSVGIAVAGRMVAEFPIALTSAAALLSRSLRRLRQTSSIASISFKKLGLGKYVPP